MTTLRPDRTAADDTDGRPESDAPRSAYAAARIRLGRVFNAESGNYFFLLGTTLFLVLFGVTMVLSSSSVESYVAENDFFGGFSRQAMFVAIGVPMMLLVSRLPERFWMRMAWPALIVSCFLQFLVVGTGLGATVGGNTNWLVIGPVSFQPSEMIKVALVIWLGLMVTRKEAQLNDLRRGVLPILLVGGAAIGLVLLGGDLGTVMIMGLFLFGTLFLIGVRFRVLLLPIVATAALFGFFAISSENRLARITSFLAEECTDYINGCWQIQHGMFALANGGLFGVGLGNSTAKWSWLPAADNDFIFAIVGEELGLIGAVVVIGMFVLMAVALIRIMRATTSPFARTATAAVLVWLIGQACVNIGVVLGVLPVLGVPLPLISAGGTALLTTLLAIGIVLSFARERPERPWSSR